MRPEEIKQEINILNLAEKVLLVEDIWDSIAQGNSELPMPEWQKRELDIRYKAWSDPRSPRSTKLAINFRILKRKICQREKLKNWPY